MRASFPELRGLWPARTLRGIGRDGKPTNSGAFAEISPLLIYIAVVLALLFVVLQIDAHKGELEALGLLSSKYPVPAALLGP
jgi:hypothetical protein